ncbi:MAG: 4Fe-4S binding protein [Candidatus Sulfobium sp.]
MQIFFLLLSISTGYQFYEFVAQLQARGHALMQRPPSVDAFLPIAGLMSFKYFLFTGNIEPFHPAALVMFTAVVLVSLMMKKGFCGWICPVGTISQAFWMAGEKIFGRNWIADVKTMEFFTMMSSTAFWVLLGIGALSVLYRNFWCRYLCPYGALLGLLSRFSPVKIRRNGETCTHCGSCSVNCPSLIDVEKQGVVSSAECFGCLTCLSHCPSNGALEVTAKKGKARRPFPPFLYPVVLLLLFYLVIGVGIVSGKWRSQVPAGEYARIIHDASR